MSNNISKYLDGQIGIRDLTESEFYRLIGVVLKGDMAENGYLFSILKQVESEFPELNEELQKEHRPLADKLEQTAIAQERGTESIVLVATLKQQRQLAVKVLEAAWKIAHPESSSDVGLSKGYGEPGCFE